ncbi:rho GTPase-activating protein gacF isoform X2 [Anopheles merus]|uniref:rho GTPase-activating protein gacF isoform X2 n=1 Tax=Anopheles merus TaxID=30066 RepID=UPI001BE435EF|nr:rho GTPase-activating protein gacF isoform X2 [Anopheles merus]
MNAAPDFGTAIRQNGSPKHDFPLQNGPNHHPVEYQNYIGGGAGGGGGGGMQTQQPNHQQQQQQQQQDLTIDGIPNNFPHRRSRASRTFKNPPQPHMCIKERTLDGKEVFINVLSWTRIANPDNPDAPIPLYGGMKVGKIPPGSPKAPPLVYAVMASPEVLKKAGRKCPDTPERMNLVDLMCEFVEAMNPSLHLSRKPEILKDRDLSGELKDVWSAVQACRDKGRSDNGPPENLVVYTEFGPDSAPSYEQTIQQHHHQQQHQQQLQYQQQYDQLPNTPDQQGRFPLSAGQQQQQQQHHYPYHHQQQQQQSAITHNNHSNSSILTSIEPISTLSATDGANGTDGSPQNGSSCYAMLDEFLSKEAESLRLSASNAAASATPAPVPAKESSKSSSGHTFFPMFRSSKSSSSSSSSSSTTTNSNSSSGANNNTANNAQLSAGSQAGEKPTVNGGSEPAAPASSAPTSDSAQGAPEPPTPKAAKTSSKKSGLNFFRRNKSSTAAAASDTASSKKDPSTTPTKQPPAPVVVASVLPAGLSSATSAPATPAATGAASTGPTEAKLQDNMPDALPSHGLANHRTHQHSGAYHLDGGSNNGSNGGGGDGEMHETASAATIAAK